MHRQMFLIQIWNKVKSLACNIFRSGDVNSNSRFTIKALVGFTLAEVLITLGIIGIVAEITIPTIIHDTQNRELAASLLNFNSNLQQAIMLWKANEGCISDAKTCITALNLSDGDSSMLEKTFGQYLSIVDKVDGTANTADWLPADTLDYYGKIYAAANYGKVAQKGSRISVYLLKDGTTLSVDSDIVGAIITVDVNGKKKPNRVGKDVFQLTVGGLSGKDVFYGPFHPFANSVNVEGLCPWETYVCNTTNVNPTVGNGANPTEYVILNKELPDYKALSQTVTGFAP